MAKVLVVEDDSNLAEIYRLSLEKENYLTVWAENGRRALRWLEEELNPHLVILDVGLPDMSGVEVCKQIKNNYKTRDIPIIILTGFTDNKVKMDANLTAHADLFLNKPIDIADLLRASAEIIAAKEKERKIRKMHFRM